MDHHHPRRAGRRRRSAGRRTRASPATSTPATRSSSTTARSGCRSTRSTARTCTPRSMVGGKVSDNKGINLPGVAVSVPALSEKDVEDLRLALRLGVDFVALSFVRSATDVDDVRKVMDEEGRRVPVIAKIEKPQAIEQPRRASSSPSTGSWSRAATSAWSARSRTCRSSRSASSTRPAAAPSRSSSRPRCSSR